MKFTRSCLALFLLVLLASCQSNAPETPSQTKHSTVDFEVLTDAQSIIKEENVSIYPILLDDNTIEGNFQSEKIKSLREGLQTQGFRITEKKPYGTDRRENAINVLTVHNKSQDTIYLMTGDVVQGGRQDRMIAQDLIVPPRTLTDVDVFCVEPNRWNFHHELIDSLEVDETTERKPQYVFSGYYNMASSDLRKTIHTTYDQNKIWAKVGDITSSNEAESSTGTYAALEKSTSYTQLRDNYLKRLLPMMEAHPKAVGLVFANGDKILGCDIFSNPNLFQQQYEALLHGYLTEAISKENDNELSVEKLERYVNKTKKKLNSLLQKENTETNLFTYQGEFVHFSE